MLTDSEKRRLAFIRSEVERFNRSHNIEDLKSAKKHAAAWYNANKERKSIRIAACRTIKNLFAQVR